MDEQNVAEIRRRVFEGVVPVRFTLEDLDVPLCFNVPRCISLGAFAYHQLSYFLKDTCPDLWFSHNDQPLRWSLPVGAIYDALCPNEGPVQSLSIDIHTRNIPDTVVRCESAETATYHFCQSFKESMFLTEGNIIPSQETTHQRLESCVRTGDVATFTELFPLRFKTFGSWKIWPIKFITREAQPCVAFLPVEGDGQTIKDAMSMKGIEGDAVIVHGVKIDAGMKLTEVVPVLLSPDGFFYANLL